MAIADALITTFDNAEELDESIPLTLCLTVIE